MGEQNVEEQLDEAALRSFMRHLLDDVEALEQMLDRGMIESGVRRIGAEQEMFLINKAGGPAPLAMKMLEQLDDRFTTELALFNLEANMKPFHLAGQCLRRLEREIVKVIGRAREVAQSLGGDVVLCGILPTLRLEDLTLDNMTPKPRYLALNRTMQRLRGGDFTTLIKGLDELQITHDNILLEACNTSFQVHFQTGPREFAKLYNLAQAVTAPVLAAAVNSAVLLQHRLWAETRIALFQQSVDIRSEVLQKRGRRPRVSFGRKWMDDSVIEIFKEDISRLRLLLGMEVDDDSLAQVSRGEPASLEALRLYNGTVYRWNRPCYGVAAGKAHLRIENRVLPAGPTPLDEVANAAFFFGLMSRLLKETGPIHKAMSFDDAKGNFLAAARHGLDGHFKWTGGRTIKASDLILEELLPIARDGLLSKKVDEADIDRYLGTIEERVTTRRTGAQWVLDSWPLMAERGLRKEERQAALVKHLVKEQTNESRPVHEWELCDPPPDAGPVWHSYLYVGQIMSADLFTVRAGDLVDLAASVMQWEHVRHVPVEDDQGHLLGLVSYRDLLSLVGRRGTDKLAIADIMRREVHTVTPRTKTVDAIRLMRDERVACLPVVDGERLVGIVTESDFLEVAGRVIEEHLDEAAAEPGTA